MDYGVAAELLKHYLYTLPEPLLTFNLYDSFILSLAIINEDDRVNVLRGLLNETPLAFRASTKKLLGVLYELHMSEEASLTAEYIAKELFPGFLRPQEPSHYMVHDDRLVWVVVQFMIEHYPSILHPRHRKHSKRSEDVSEQDQWRTRRKIYIQKETSTMHIPEEGTSVDVIHNNSEKRSKSNEHNRRNDGEEGILSDGIYSNEEKRKEEERRGKKEKEEEGKEEKEKREEVRGATPLAAALYSTEHLTSDTLSSILGSSANSVKASIKKDDKLISVVVTCGERLGASWRELCGPGIPPEQIDNIRNRVDSVLEVLINMLERLDLTPDHVYSLLEVRPRPILPSEDVVVTFPHDDERHTVFTSLRKSLEICHFMEWMVPPITEEEQLIVARSALGTVADLLKSRDDKKKDKTKKGKEKRRVMFAEDIVEKTIVSENTMKDEPSSSVIVDHSSSIDMESSSKESSSSSSTNMDTSDNVNEYSEIESAKIKGASRLADITRMTSYLVDLMEKEEEDQAITVAAATKIRKALYVEAIHEGKPLIQSLDDFFKRHHIEKPPGPQKPSKPSGHTIDVLKNAVKLSFTQVELNADALVIQLGVVDTVEEAEDILTMLDVVCTLLTSFVTIYDK